MKPTSFCNACERLANILIERGYEVAADLLVTKTISEFDQHSFRRSKFYSLALRYCLDDGMRWAERLHTPDSIPYWHLVDLAWERTPAHIDEERYHVATSMANALAFVISEIDKQSIIPSSVSTEKDRITFYLNDKLIAEIKLLKFTSVDKNIELRVTRQFEKICRPDDIASVINRFKKIPGLGGVCNTDKRAVYYPLVATTKSFVNRMAQFLKNTVGVIPKHSELLEITASFFEFDSWNHFSGAEKKYDARLERPYMVFSSHSGKVTDINFYLGKAAAFVDFGNTLKNKPQSKFDISSLATGTYANTDITKVEEDTLEEQLYLCPTNKIYSSEIPIKAAEAILASNDIERALLAYFGSELSSYTAQLHNRANRLSDKSKHLLLGRWLVFTKPGNSGYDEFVMEYYDISEKKRLERISGSQYKCSFVFEENSGSYWLSDDWDDKPAFLIKGLNIDQIKEIEREFFPCENRLIHRKLMLEASAKAS